MSNKKERERRTAAEESVKNLSTSGPGTGRGKRDAATGRNEPRDAGSGRRGIAGVPGSKNPERRCTATVRSTGERCKRAAIKGGNVCTSHGGAAPQVRKSAKERLLELADPAIAALSKIVRDENTDDAVRLRAALGIVDRIGLGPGQKIEIGVGKFDEAIASAVGLELDAIGNVTLNRDLARAADQPALETGVGDPLGTEDYEQHVKDAQAEAWREYDHEDAEAAERGRIRPDENTVRGEVVEPVQGRYERAPDLGPTDPPRYWDEEARRGDG